MEHIKPRYTVTLDITFTAEGPFQASETIGSIMGNTFEHNEDVLSIEVKQGAKFTIPPTPTQSEEQVAKLRAWADTLESGAYQQARGALCVRDERGEAWMCCLGVLCDIVNPSWNRPSGDGEIMPEDNVNVFQPKTDDGRDVEVEPYSWADTTESSTLPLSVSEEFGISPSGNFRIKRHREVHRIENDETYTPEGMPDAFANAIAERESSLASMNDNGATFADIAATIRFILDNPDIAVFAPRLGIESVACTTIPMR